MHTGLGMGSTQLGGREIVLGSAEVKVLCVVLELVVKAERLELDDAIAQVEDESFGNGIVVEDVEADSMLVVMVVLMEFSTLGRSVPVAIGTELDVLRNSMD